MKRIIFVDDDANLLGGLRRMLRPHRHEWEMEFYISGPQALEALASKPCDAVVSDMRMPGMDGAELLSKVKEISPASIRIALSGQTDPSAIYRCISHSHQHLAKPCDADQLRSTIARALSLQNIITLEPLKQLIASITSLPSLPEAYSRIMQELQSPHASPQAVAAIVESDVAMTARVLQLVNSAYFGLPRQVTSAAEAAMFLGTDVIRHIVLSTGIFSQFDDDAVQAMGLNDVWANCNRIGPLARAIALDFTQDKKTADDAMMAGMICDVGTLVLAVARPDDMTAIRNMGNEQGLPDWQIEQDILGFSHAEVGAYLIALWGLPNPIVEAVAFHHAPHKSVSTAFEPLTAVHIACHLSSQPSHKDAVGLDMTYIERLQIAREISRWREICEDTVTA